MAVGPDQPTASAAVPAEAKPLDRHVARAAEMELNGVAGGRRRQVDECPGRWHVAAPAKVPASVAGTPILGPDQLPAGWLGRFAGRQRMGDRCIGRRVRSERRAGRRPAGCCRGNGGPTGIDDGGERNGETRAAKRGEKLTAVHGFPAGRPWARAVRQQAAGVAPIRSAQPEGDAGLSVAPGIETPAGRRTGRRRERRTYG